LTTTQRIQTSTVAVTAVGDPWLLKAAIPPRFIANATFAAAPSTFDQIFRFVGGNSAEPLQFDAGRAGPFLGRPKIEWPTMVSTLSTTGSKIMIAGDSRPATRSSTASECRWRSSRISSVQPTVTPRGSAASTHFGGPELASSR
jgi:hypothetical protein